MLTAYVPLLGVQLASVDGMRRESAIKKGKRKDIQYLHSNSEPDENQREYTKGNSLNNDTNESDLRGASPSIIAQSSETALIYRYTPCDLGLPYRDR